MRTGKELILQELENSTPIEFRPGMQLSNTPSNGAIDSSSLGYNYAIQTTTQIRAKTIDQKFYTFPFGEYIPVIPGEAAWMESIKTNAVYLNGGPFEQGIVNTGANQQVFASVDVATAPISQAIALWVKEYSWNMFEVNKALASDNWDIIAGRLKALKVNWDLGLQQVAYLGLTSDQTNFPGLLSNPNVNINLTVISKNISTFANSGGDYQAFVSAIFAAYFANSNNTVSNPTHFAMPQNDYLGLGIFINPAFPNQGSMFIDALQKVFAMMTGNPGFVIYGVLYAQMSVNAGVWTTNGTQRYALYRNDPDSVRIDLPLDIVMAAPVPIGPATYKGLAYGQFTGVVFFRPAEALYFDHT